MPAASNPSPDNIEMSSIFGALRKALPRLVIWSLLAAGLTYAGLSTVAPRFQSEAEIAIVAKGPSNSLSDPKAAGGAETVSVKMDKEAVNTHVRALQSDDLLSKIADGLNLKDNREFNSAIGPLDTYDEIARMAGIGGPRQGESERDRVMSALKRQTEIYAVKESRSIGIRATATEPQLAADIANRIAENYRASLANAATQEVDDQQKVLQGKVEKLVEEVAEAETEVDRYRGEANVFKGGAQNTSLNEQQLSEITAELSRVKSARSEAEARAKSAREMMKSGSAEALPDVQKSPLIQNLMQQRVRIERQISELSATLLPAHPRMQQLTADLAGLKKQLSTEVAKQVDSLEKEAKVAQGREESIKKSLDELKAKVVTKAPEEAKLRQLEANAKAKRTELENIQAQLESNRKRLDTRAQPVEAQIMKTAQAASLAVFPKKTQSSALIGFAALLLGTFLTITRALFKGARGQTEGKTEEQPVASRKEPVLAAAPKLKDAAKKASQTASMDNEPPSPAIMAAAARLRKAAPDKGGYRTLVASESNDIDSGAEAAGLARAISQSGANVVLVNWNLSGRELSGFAPHSRKGICDLITGGAGFEDVVQRLPGSKAHYIGCGTALSDPSAIDPDHLNLVLDALDEAYDHIIVTGPHDDARDLFEAIQGRFDAGLQVADGNGADAGAEGTFLGFEVSDIDVIKVGKAGATAPVPSDRLQRVTRKVNTRAAS